MRAVRRVQFLPPTLGPSGTGGKKAEAHLQQWETSGVPPASFSEEWRKPDVLGFLLAIQGKVCAYCGCTLEHSDRGDVEHFRPKKKVVEDPQHGGYWWLAYSVENYLLSCLRCNRTHKQDRFPLLPEGVRVRFADRHLIPDEPRLLLHPALDPVEDWLQVEWSDERRLCLIRPSLRLTDRACTQIEGTLEFFRINTDPLLIRARQHVLDGVLNAVRDGRGDAARQLAIRYRPNSLVAKQILAELAPEFLPQPQEELDWLLKDISMDLDVVRALLKEGGHSPKIEKGLKAEENKLLWSFAVLWHDPPAGQSVDVEAFLTGRSIVGDVRRRRDRLVPLRCSVVPTMSP